MTTIAADSPGQAVRSQFGHVRHEAGAAPKARSVDDVTHDSDTESMADAAGQKLVRHRHREPGPGVRIARHGHHIRGAREVDEQKAGTIPTDAHGCAGGLWHMGRSLTPSVRQRQRGVGRAGPDQTDSHKVVSEGDLRREGDRAGRAAPPGNGVHALGRHGHRRPFRGHARLEPRTVGGFAVHCGAA